MKDLIFFFAGDLSCSITCSYINPYDTLVENLKNMIQSMSLLLETTW